MIKITSSNDALEQELTCVRAERDGWRDAYEDAKRDAEVARADLAAARANAERYRWLRSTNAFTLLAIAWSHPAAQAIGEDCDSAIDAAIAGEKK